ncbi:MAG: hypothetical protein SGJ19_04995 [Planctomycetia bacterium]|nr:hypothetical protein [Planctomycetia bacterium]
MGDKKKIEKFENDIKAKETQIELAEDLLAKWKNNNAKSPLTSADERILASGAHGVHGKASYGDAFATLKANIKQANKELVQLRKELKEEQDRPKAEKKPSRVEQKANMGKGKHK